MQTEVLEVVFTAADTVENAISGKPLEFLDEDSELEVSAASTIAGCTMDFFLTTMQVTRNSKINNARSYPENDKDMLLPPFGAAMGDHLIIPVTAPGAGTVTIIVRQRPA